ncbi:hypothetical protein [Serratia microhaemolytica]|uniref:hypothetical protein n=1 Tax=Serratia microhaemolytica TaxID=2675110 RepID=UPI000FDD4306|nr:hypothetical protein [Serratia microhaemolytica]
MQLFDLHALLHLWRLTLVAAGLALSGYASAEVTEQTECNISVNMPVVDYGKNYRSELPLTSDNSRSFGKRKLTLSIVCPSEQPMRLQLHGEKAQNDFLRYEKGYVKVEILQGQLDGKNIQFAMLGADNIPTGSPANNLAIRPNDRFAVTLNNQVASGTTLNAQIEVEAILPDNSVRVSDFTSFTTSMSVELLN